MLLNLTELSAESLHRQILRQLTDKIVDGELSDGSELLPINVLARSQHVSKSTVQRAYENLEKGGLINSIQGKGFFVAALTSAQKQAIVKRRIFSNCTSLNVVESLEKQKLTEELNMARKIQKDLLPKELPNNEHFQIAAYSKPSLAVGGDFYDCLTVDENHFGLVIGDACGKGLSAAMLISQIQVMLKNDVHHNNSIQQTMKCLNKHLWLYTSARNFATLFYGIFDKKTCTFEFANAGQNYPIIVRDTGEIEYLKTTGPALGLSANDEHKTQKVNMRKGDCILFYTDGVTEAMNEKKEEFGEQRLVNLIKQIRHLDAQDIIQSVIKDLETFQNSTFVHDDRAILMLKVF